MHKRAKWLLKQELASQVLSMVVTKNGALHLLMLDRLIELACVLSATNGESPIWLVDSIQNMATWAALVRLESGTAPRFNDSADDAALPLDEVLAFAAGYLKKRSSCSGLRRMLLKINDSNPIALPDSSLALAPHPAPVTDLPATGWTFLRPGHGWELSFKCGIPCPSHLAAHAHSDLLSFDLWYQGQPVIAEVGTSVYGSGQDRLLERSSASHNSLQLGSCHHNTLTWIEPVEVWAGFRAGRKAQPHSRSQGCEGPWLWVPVVTTVTTPSMPSISAG